MLALSLLQVAGLSTALVSLPFAQSAAVGEVSSHSLHARKPGSGGQPNFVYIITDDQDAGTATPDVMPHVYKHMAQKGLNFTNFYAPVSQCCPSRVGFLRGQHGHSHNITSVGAPFGGYEIYCDFGYNGEHLFTWLQDAGYQTYYTGKLMNGNSLANAERLPVIGLDGSGIFLDPFTYNYLNNSISFNGGPPQAFPGVYSTDHVRDISLGFLDKAAKSSKPFFVGIAPIGPHTHATRAPNWENPIPADRHKNLFNDRVAPRKGSFNPDVPSGASWLRGLEKLNSTHIDYIDGMYRDRLRALQSVDELVDAVYKKLDKLGLSENTYVVYTSDNGFQLGLHRRQPGKTTGYEEDIKVPLFVTGPGIKKGIDSSSAHSNIDLTATYVHLAGADPKVNLDGRVMDWGKKDAKKSQIGSANHVLSEFWLVGGAEGKFASSDPRTSYAVFPTNANFANNTYRVLRVIEEGFDLAYAVWCTGERELYNMKTDSDQMNNLLLESNARGRFTPYDMSKEAERLASRMDAITLSLKYCHGVDCRFSWKNVFPYGEATSLEQALDRKFDAYFSQLPVVEYTNCQIGFHLEREFPYWTTDLPYYNNMTSIASVASGRHAGGKKDDKKKGH